MVHRTNVSMPDEHGAFLEAESLSPSALLQSAIEEKAEQMDVDLDDYEPDA